MTPAERLLAMLATDQGKQLAEKLVDDLREAMHRTHRLCALLGIFVEAARPPYGEGANPNAANTASTKDNDAGAKK